MNKQPHVAVVGANKRSYYHDANKTRAIFTISKSM